MKNKKKHGMSGKYKTYLKQLKANLDRMPMHILQSIVATLGFDGTYDSLWEQELVSSREKLTQFLIDQPKGTVREFGWPINAYLRNNLSFENAVDENTSIDREMRLETALDSI